MLKANNNNRIFRQTIISKFTLKTTSNKPNKRGELNIKYKQAEVIKIPSPILPRPFKETLEKSKIFHKKDIKPNGNANFKERKLYAQTTSPNIKEILKINENFPNLLAKKIENIHNTINNFGKVKPRINMTTKDSSKRQIIVSMSDDNKLKFMLLSNSHIANLNRVLKNIKLDIIANFVRLDQYGIIITINKVASVSDLYTIENYIKNTDNMNLDDILPP